MTILIGKCMNCGEVYGNKVIGTLESIYDLEPSHKCKRGREMSEDTIISCLSNDLFVEPNLIVEEIMTASNLKASLRLAVEDFANYPMLLEKLASKF